MTWTTKDTVMAVVGVAGAAILIGTVIEDVFTLGIGILDDPLTIPVGFLLLMSSLTYFGLVKK